MKNRPLSKEKGQILVVFAVVLVALLGLTALAIDGSMVFSDRRFAQSAADTAALAGAGKAADGIKTLNNSNFNCASGAVTSAIAAAKNSAIDSASLNAFTIDTDVSDKHGVTVDCGTVNHLDSKGNVFYKENYLDVKTYITSTTPTSFAQLFTTQPLVNSVEAVVRVHPPVGLGMGNAILSLSDVCKQGGNIIGGIWADGKGTVKINGGGMFSFSCINTNGPPTVDVTGYIGYMDGADPFDPQTATFPGTFPVKTTTPLPYVPFPEPVCPTTASKGKMNGTDTFEPGNYSEISITNGETATLKPGLYCVTGHKGVSVSGVIKTVESHTWAADPANKNLPAGVTIFVKEGPVTINGGSNIDLHAPYYNTQVNAGSVQGMLIFMAFGNASNVNITGNDTSYFGGTIYAPDGSVEIGGTSATNSPIEFGTQLIGQLIKVHGDVEIDIKYQADTEPKGGSLLDMEK